MMALKEISLQDRVTVFARQISLCLQVRLVRSFVFVLYLGYFTFAAA